VAGPVLFSQNSMNTKHSVSHSKHRAHLNTVVSTARSAMSKRRSNRMLLHAAVGLSGEDRQKCTFTMPARATNLNKHGAAVQLPRDLVVGSVVSLRNQRGIEVPARVVAVLTATKGMSTYGIEFVKTDEPARNFWGISFPSGE